MDYMSEFARRLKAQREKMHFTQAQLADKIGVSSQTISAYEKNSAGEKGKTPTLDKAVALAQVLNVSLDYLCGLEQTTDSLEFTNLAEVVSYLEKLTEYFNCCVGIKTVPLPEEEWEFITDDYGNTIEIDTTNLACLTIENSTLANFFRKRNEVYKLYTDKTIDKDIYDTWVHGETEKLKKWVIQKHLGDASNNFGIS